jgi:glycine cleavage system pyridoxal-binding protein P
MRYLPKSPADREAMLAEIGVDSIDELFATIPAEYQLTRDLAIPRQHSESEIIDRFRAFSENNATGYASFLATTSRSSSTRSSCAANSSPATPPTSRRSRKAPSRPCSSSRP